MILTLCFVDTLGVTLRESHLRLLWTDSKMHKRYDCLVTEEKGDMKRVEPQEVLHYHSVGGPSYELFLSLDLCCQF